MQTEEHFICYIWLVYVTGRHVKARNYRTLINEWAVTWKEAIIA